MIFFDLTSRLTYIIYIHVDSQAGLHCKSAGGKIAVSCTIHRHVHRHHISLLAPLKTVSLTCKCCAIHGTCMYSHHKWIINYHYFLHVTSKMIVTKLICFVAMVQCTLQLLAIPYPNCWVCRCRNYDCSCLLFMR